MNIGGLARANGGRGGIDNNIRKGAHSNGIILHLSVTAIQVRGQVINDCTGQKVRDTKEITDGNGIVLTCGAGQDIGRTGWRG